MAMGVPNRYLKFIIRFVKTERGKFAASGKAA